MAAQTFQPIAARPAPVKTEGLVPWIRANLFGNWQTSAGTVILGGLLLWIVPNLLGWALFRAAWAPDAEACRLDGVGACWGVVAEKYRLIIFGRYPFEEQWRPLVATLLMVGLLVASCARAFWKPWLALLWLAVLGAYFTIMFGGVLGLSRVETDRWGGLPLTILLASLSIAMAFPIALLVALGRRSNMPAIRSACTVYVELIRGVPLINSTVHAAGLHHRRADPCAGGHYLVCRGLHGRSHTRRVAGDSQRTGGSGCHAGPVVLADPTQDRTATGAGHGGAGHHERVYFHLQGHLPGHHRELV